MKSYASAKINPTEVFISEILTEFYKIDPWVFNRHFYNIWSLCKVRALKIFRKRAFKITSLNFVNSSSIVKTTCKINTLLATYKINNESNTYNYDRTDFFRSRALKLWGGGEGACAPPQVTFSNFNVPSFSFW